MRGRPISASRNTFGSCLAACASSSANEPMAKAWPMLHTERYQPTRTCAAALHDPRFEPLTERELDGLSVEVSLLSTAQPLAVRDEDDLVRQLQAARDGVLLEYGHLRSTFLPQVWEQLPDARDFLRHLKAKAGLSPEFWSPDLRVSCYVVEKWSER